MAERTPVTIVTGFLGSGKTTLLRRFLAAGAGVRTAALINDFGALGLDGELVTAVGDSLAPVIELANGCVCCTINEDLQRALATVLALDPPVAHILVETTGVADPMPVVATLTRPELRARLRVDGVITLIDAGAPIDDVIATVAGQAQIAAADVLIINKVDLAAADDLADLEEQLIVRKGAARLLRAQHADIALGLLTSIGRFDPMALPAEDHACAAHGCTDEHAHTHAHAGRDHLSVDGFRSISVILADALDERRFQRFLWDHVPAEVYRGKGLVLLGPQRRPYVFHRVGARTTFDPWDQPVDRPRAVFIGRLTDDAVAALRSALLGCGLDAA